MYVYGPDFVQIYQNRLASEGRSVQVMQSCDGSDLVLCTVECGLRAIVFLYVFL